MAPVSIHTSRLCLLPLHSTHVEGFFQSRAELAKRIGARVPDSYPVFPESMAYWKTAAAPAPESLNGWGMYLVLWKEPACLVGEVGFKGGPDETGQVEVGYAIVPEHRRRGFASEATGALVEHAFTHPLVRSVTAHTLKQGRESIGVLEKLGFAFVTELEDPEEGTIVRWQRNRTVP